MLNIGIGVTIKNEFMDILDDWLLKSNFWDDNGVWYDNRLWQD